MVWVNSDTLSKFRFVVHGFSNRQFKGDLEETARNFGLSTVFTLAQVHSADVIVIEDGFKKEPGRKGDAIITGQKGMGIGVFTADCVPILLVDESASCVAVVHAGWRGTLYQVSQKTLQEMRRHFGTDPSRVRVVLGPSIGKCCYEVGEDVASPFMEKFKDNEGYLFKKGNSKYIFDLREINRLSLLEEGVKSVEVMNICTKCDNNFHSYRRDGKKVGSQLSFIGLV
jgi:hypothetical protein